MQFLVHRADVVVRHGGVPGVGPALEMGKCREVVQQGIVMVAAARIAHARIVVPLADLEIHAAALGDLPVLRSEDQCAVRVVEDRRPQQFSEHR